MVKKCCVAQSRVDVVGHIIFGAEPGEESFCTCFRKEGHNGPHLIKRLQSAGGTFVLWQRSLCKDVECYSLRSKNPNDWCIVYKEISEEEANKYISKPKFIGNGWKK